MVRVHVCCALLPTVTLPKALLIGLIVREPVAVPEPVPDSAIFETEFDALLLNVATALNVPAALGVNFTLSVAFCPGAIVTGRADASVKYCVENVALVMFSDALPEFVATTVMVLLDPEVTPPKLSD